MRTRVSVGILVLSIFTAFPLRAEDDTATAILKSAGGKGAEIAAKQLAKILYDTSCTTGNQDPTNKYICSILGSVSGRAEEEWKADVTKKLNEISDKLKTIESAQNRIQSDLKLQHAVMLARFDQVSLNIVAVSNLVRIEGLWEKYEDQFDKVDNDVTRDSMLAFAKDIVNNNLHTKLADLNVVLTKDVLDGQPLLRYPFYEWRMKQTSGTMLDRFDPTDVYDFSEKKFADLRLTQQKAYLMYLWAATVLESQCKLKPEQCSGIPRSTADFKADYGRYTEQQLETFNAGLDWLILSCSTARATLTGSVLPNDKAKALYVRANFLTSATLSPNLKDASNDGRGLWGRVFSMGNKWDGELTFNCNGATQTIKPVLKYPVPVGGGGLFIIAPDSGPLDWWVASAGKTSNVYDEVHFSDKWQVYHYNVPAAKAGPCSAPAGAFLPWVQPNMKVVDVTTADERSFPFGSFLAIQRAGGHYALISGGTWSGYTEPARIEDGPGQREKVEYEWIIERDHPTGPYIGVYSKGRGEFKVRNGSSRIHNRNKIVLNQSKMITFPDGGIVKLHYVPGNCSGEFCNGPGRNSIIAYDIENNDTEDKKGKLDALATVCFRDTAIDDLETGPGMTVNAGYGKTGDRKTANINDSQVGVMELNPAKKYQLTFLLYFDLETQGRGLDATTYWYRGLLAPAGMYLTR